MTFLAVIDPAWGADSGGGGKGANEHYELAGVEALARGYDTHEAWRQDGPALVFMWATASALAVGDAHKLAALLRLRICAGFVWAKADAIDLESITTGYCEGTAYMPHAKMGLGQWTRCEHEHLFICRRGDVTVPMTELRQRSMIYAPRGEHSAKPDAAWIVIERTANGACPGVEGVEFNARKRRDGWQAVGRLDGEDNPIRWEK